MHVLNLSSLVSDKSRFQYIQVEVTRNKTYIYISDAGANAIIVWDITKRLGHKVVLPNDVPVGGDHSCTNDVLYIVLLKGKCGDVQLYFTYLHAKKMFLIETQYLRSGKTEGTIDEVGTKPGRIVLLGSDGGTILFFRLRGQADIFMWNSTTEFSSENLLLAQPIDSGRFPTHINAGYRRLIWTLESNFPDFMENRINDLGPSVKIHPTIKYCKEDYLI